MTPRQAVDLAEVELKAFIESGDGKFRGDEGDKDRAARHFALEEAKLKAAHALDAERRKENVRFALLSEIEQRAIREQFDEDERLTANLAKRRSEILSGGKE
jgi:hypothetical protein